MPVETKGYNGSTLLGHLTTQYGPLDAISSHYNPSTITTKKGTSNVEERIAYELYDNFGNLLQYRIDDNTPVTYLWGYHNKTYPVAKVINAEFTQVQSILTNSEYQEMINSATTDQRMRQILQKVRTQLPNAMVTSYTYKQGVGISSTTDPRGYTMYYEYDDSQRLKFVRDAQGNILSENSYHYQTQD